MKSIWIVGASTGIGKSLAILYATNGDKVFASARSEQKLATLSEQWKHLPGEIVPVCVDVSDNDSIEHATTLIQRESGDLDKVIVIAGTCEYIDDVQIESALLRRVFETNLFGAIAVSNAAIPLLKNALEPQLVFVSSSVTYQALPRAHAYGASKAALRYFAECLKIDLQKQGIDVRVVSPGFVETPLTDKNDFDMPFIISSDKAAKRIVKGLEAKSFDINFPKRFTYTLKLFSWLPDRIKFKLLGKMSRYDALETRSEVSH